MRKPKVNIVSWLELNRPTTTKLKQFYEGAKHWREVTKTMIVSTVPGQESLFGELSFIRKGVTNEVDMDLIVPGLKTKQLWGRFDSLQGWKAVAKSVEVILKHCPDTKRIVLENETAMRPFLRGEEKVGVKRLQRAVRQLPQHIEYLWWPTYAGHTLAVLDRYFAVANAVARGLYGPFGLRFIGRLLASPDAPDDVWMRYAALRMNHLPWPFDPDAVPLIWCGGKKRPAKFWSYAQVPSVLDLVEGDEAIIYPGSKNWVEAAKALAVILAKRKPVKRLGRVVPRARRRTDRG